MEKKKIQKSLRKIVAIVSIVSVLLAMLSLSVGASSVSYSEMDVYSPSIPLNRIEVVNLRAPNVSIEPNYFVTESPFTIFCGKSSVSGKTGVVFNYPLQDNTNFTSTGRTCFYSYSTIVELFGLDASFYNPIIYSDGVTSPFVLDNAQSVIYCFDDFVLDNSDYFTIVHHLSEGVSSVLPIYRITFDVVSLIDEEYIVDSFEFNLTHAFIPGLTLSYDMLKDNLAYFYSYDLEQDSLISNLKVEFEPRGGAVVGVNDVTQVEILCSMQEADSLYFDVTEWYTQHPIIKEVFVGLGDLSLFDWLGVAIGGFFDFEIAPNFSLGGVLLVVIGLGLLTFIIKVFK